MRTLTLNDPSWTLEEASKHDDSGSATASVEYNYGCWGGNDITGSVDSAAADSGQSDPVVARISYGYGKWGGGCGCGGSGCGGCGG